MQELKSFNILSVAKVMGVLYAILGEIAGILIAIASLVHGRPIRALLAVLFLGAIYAIIGFISGALLSWLYNLIAAQFGGIDLELVQR